MASNLSTLGFVFADNDAFADAMTRLAGDAVERLSCPAGDYAMWRSRTGAELWFHLGADSENKDERQIIGLTPFFEGRSAIPMRVMEPLTRPDDNPLEGAFYAWVAPDDTGEGAYPIVFDAADFAAHAGRHLPATWSIRLAAFAREVKAFPSEAAYLAVPDRSPPLGGQSFIPMGLFAQAAAEDSKEVDAVPSSTAILTGHVVECARLVNEETGRPFHWMLVESLEATYDCVADPDVVEGDIVAGGTVEVACWLFGRVLD